MNAKLRVPGGLRAFAAVEVPAGLLKALARLQAELGTRGVRARWTRPQNLHLTLKFLGDIPTARVEDVMQALQSAAALHAAFSLTAAGIGAFPDARRPRVIWAGLAGATDALAQLQREIDDRLDAIGFPREVRGFHGHLTLGRVQAGAGAGGVAAALSACSSACFGSFEVREVVLFQSDLQPRGAVYAAVGRAPLKAR